MNASILRILLKKEVLMLRRNPFIPRMMVAMPIMVMLIMPLVATMDVKNVGVAAVDNDRTELSRRMIVDMDASEYLSVIGCFYSYDEAFRWIEEGEVDAIVTIPKDYLKDLTNGDGPSLDLKANGVNATKGTLGAQYATMSMAQTISQWQAEQGISLPASESATLDLYNPTLDYRNYMIPALMIMLLILICGFFPTLNLVSEKESGTIEAMNVTPVGRFEFVLSKLVPYWAVGILVIMIGMIIGRLVYGLSPAGNLGAIYLAAILFSLIMSGFGVFVANQSSTILQSIFMMFAFIIICMLMSGLFTPVASMPQWAQYITYAIPPRYFIEIMRSVYLKGSAIPDLWLQYVALLGFAMLFCLLAAMTYKKRA